MKGGVQRRTFLKLAAAGSAAGLASWSGCAARWGWPGDAVTHFFDADERAAMEALAEAIVPEDQTVGAAGAHAVEYIDRFLSCFETPVPTLYRGGPFSGRAPYPDPQTGEPTDRYPENRFLEFLPPTRMQELAFKILLYGSDSVPGGNQNAPVVPATPGLRALYRTGLAQLREAEGTLDFPTLEPAARLAAFDATSREFQQAVATHLAEGLFCAPEYGGNAEAVVWRDYHYDGDSQPLGHTLFDRKTQTLRDRPDEPNQTLDPRRPGVALEPSVEPFVEGLITALGGRRF